MKRIREKPKNKKISKWNHTNRKEILSCLRKIAYSKAEVKKIAEKKGMYYYKCPYCRKYHLTKQLQNPKSILDIIQPLLDALKAYDEV